MKTATVVVPLEGGRKCTCLCDGVDGAFRHTGKLTVIYRLFSSDSDVTYIAACSNHLPIYLENGWKKAKLPRKRRGK